MVARQAPPLPGRVRPPALVLGGVQHVRHQPIRHSFTYRHYLWLVDLADVPRTPAVLGRFTRLDPRDHLGGAATFADLDSLARGRVAAAGVTLPPGTRTLVLAHARVLGHVFDPLSVFWFLDPEDRLVAAILEVRNTYGASHDYVVRPDAAGRARVDKALLVSPFNDVTGTYAVRLRCDEQRVSVAIRLERGGHAWLSASVWGAPVPLTSRSLARALVTYPLMTHRVSGLIRAHGIWLWLRRLPVSRERSVGAAPDERLAPAGRHTVLTRGRIAEVLVRRMVAGLPVRLRWPDGRERGGGGPADPVLALVRPRELMRRLETHPKIGLGEAYMAGDWQAAPGTDLAELLIPFAAGLTTLLPRRVLACRRLLDRAIPQHHRGTRSGARANVAAHYDLGNDLFETFLDETMTYSAAMFDPSRPRGQQDLAEAQRRKIDTALDAAGVGAGTRLLEIGTGWGELAIRAASRGAHVTSITLSRNQIDLARRRVRAAGVDANVDIELRDYRDVDGEFDAVVSIEMIEAVGEEFWPDYLRVIDGRLAAGGTAVVQSILMAHHRMLATRHSYGWIQKHIFPGGLVPSQRALDEAAQRHTSLRVTDSLRFGADYAETLRRWRVEFVRRWPDLVGAGYDETFRRQWEFYLAYCQAGFATGYLDVAQLTLRRTP